MDRYEVILGPAAKLFVLATRQEAREALAKSLREELDDGPNAAHAYAFSWDDGQPTYTALPLSYKGIVVIFRPLTDVELKRLRLQQQRRIARVGFYVFDFLTPESGIYQSLPLRA